MADSRPSAARELPIGARRSRLSFETRVLVGALLTASPALLALVVALSSFDASRQQWIATGVLVFIATLILAFRLRNAVAFPLYTVSNLLEALREGDFSLRGSRARRGDAIGEVVWEVNALGQTLREQRLKVEETLALLTKVLNSIDLAIFAFDSSSRLRLINPAGERLLAVRARDALGSSAESLGLSDCLALASAATIKRAFPGGSGSWEVRRAGFREGGLPHELVVVTDLSRVLREEERQAWQRLIRVLGHEINNSLAPIRSMADTLGRLILREPPPPDWREDAGSGLAVIAERSEALTRFILGYTALARLPPPYKKRFALAELIRGLAKLESERGAVCVEEGPDIELDADRDQVEQAVINLVKNAVEATRAAPASVRVRWSVESGMARIAVEDDGPGIASTDNLFVPFFTTKPGGSGIGLVLSRQIAEAHGGSLDLGNRSERSGCVATLRLPLRAA
jgi:nitrogen fixation/metabolism regulation signal transduction histidine kinase